MKRLLKYYLLVAAIWIVNTSSILAHHGFGPHYDVNQYVAFEGVVTAFEYVNPHSFVYIEVADGEGNTELRWCELQARTQLARKGFDKNAFTVGDQVTLEGFPARRDPLGCELGRAYLADGRVMQLRGTDGRSAYQAPIVAGNNSVLGTWHRKAFPGAGIDPEIRTNLTPAGEAAHDRYDHNTQYPTLFCSPTSPIQTWAQPGLAIRISREADKVLIEYEFMDARRTVHLDLIEHPASTERSVLGHSIGQFEGDDLIIETALFSAGNMHGPRLHSDQFTLTERLSVNPDNGDLELTWVASDPLYYTKRIEGSRIMVRTDLEVRPYNCVPEAGHHAG